MNKWMITTMIGWVIMLIGIGGFLWSMRNHYVVVGTAEDVALLVSPLVFILGLGVSIIGLMGWANDES